MNNLFLLLLILLMISCGDLIDPKKGSSDGVNSSRVSEITVSTDSDDYTIAKAICNAYTIKQATFKTNYDNDLFKFKMYQKNCGGSVIQNNVSINFRLEENDNGNLEYTTTGSTFGNHFEELEVDNNGELKDICEEIGNGNEFSNTEHIGSDEEKQFQFSVQNDNSLKLTVNEFTQNNDDSYTLTKQTIFLVNKITDDNEDYEGLVTTRREVNLCSDGSYDSILQSIFISRTDG